MASTSPCALNGIYEKLLSYLKHQEIARLDEDILGLQCRVIFGERNDTVVDGIFTIPLFTDAGGVEVGERGNGI